MAESGASCGCVVKYRAINVCWTACSQRHARPLHVLELRHPIVRDGLATKAALQSPDKKLGVGFVAQ